MTSPASLRIGVVSPVDPRRARTNVVADVRLCAALGAQGADVVWIVPSVGPSGSVRALDIFDIHEVPRSFAVSVVTTPRKDGLADLARVVPLAVRAMRLGLGSRALDYVVSRDLRLIGPLVLLGRGDLAVPWLHEYRGERWEALLCRRVDRILATNRAIVADVMSDSVRADTLVTGNPVPASWIKVAQSTTRVEARDRLGLRMSEPLVVYTGKLHEGMAELGYLLDVAGKLACCRFLLTGGRAEALANVRQEIERRRLLNVQLTGFLERPAEAQLYQLAADILVSYYSPKDHPFAHHNLPNKLSEYMATGNPVIVADFPAVRSFADNAVVLVEPDAPVALAEAIDALLRNPENGTRLAAYARAVASESTYERKAVEILRFLGRDKCVPPQPTRVQRPRSRS